MSPVLFCLYNRKTLRIMGKSIKKKKEQKCSAKACSLIHAQIYSSLKNQTQITVIYTVLTKGNSCV